MDISNLLDGLVVMDGLLDVNNIALQAIVTTGADVVDARPKVLRISKGETGIFFAFVPRRICLVK